MHLHFIFVGLALLLVYVWLGYPAILVLAKRLVGGRVRRAENWPSASIILAVYNEEEHIRGKLENCLAIDYPHDLMEIIVASDGSKDATEQIVQEFAACHPRVRLIRSASRAGKSGVQNLAAKQAQGDIFLFTDAETSTAPDLLLQVAAHFADPKIGMVAPVVHFGKFETSVSQGQGAYWRFELFLRQLESDVGNLATCSGSAFAIRRELFRPIPPQFGDDCIVPLDIRLQGFRIVQDPQIIVYDEMPHTIEGELRARVRMTARNWAGILNRAGIFNPLRFPATAWGLVSHKFLRWLTPFLLALLYLLNCALALRHELILLFVAQNCFYMAALIGWRRSLSKKGCEPFFSYPFAFCLANIGFLLGAVQWARGRRIVAYK